MNFSRRCMTISNRGRALRSGALLRRMKAEGRRQKAERRSSHFCLLLSAFCLHLVLVAFAAFAQTPLPLFVKAAKAQVGKTVHYDPSYRKLPYPNGDVPIDRGVCTDVVIRAFRKTGIDL